MDIKQEHQEEEQVVRVDTSDSEESKKNLMEKRLELIEVMRRSEPPSFIGSATLLKDLKVAVDLHIFPYDKFYTRQKVASGPIFLCFKELGWTQATLVLDFKRAKYWEAIIDYVLQRVSELRQRAVACIAKKCQERIERKESVPSCSEVEALLKDVCTNGFKRKYQNERENTKEKRETLYWILHVATTVQSNWDPESHDAKVSSYLQAVHPSDMAFSLYVLDEHRDRWEISVARPAKKKRVSTSANSKSTKVYLEKIGNKICRFHDRFAKDKKSNDQKLTVEFEDWFKWMHTQMEGKITKRKKATKTTEEDSTLFDRDMFQAQVKNNPNLANWQHASATISRIGL